MSDEAKVAARLMGTWLVDPFNVQVRLDRPHLCPFNEGNRRCSVAQVRGRYTSPISLPCPARDSKGETKGTPEQCPLRFGKITIERKEEGGA